MIIWLYYETKFKYQIWIDKMGSEDSEAAAWGCPQASFSPSPPWPSPCLCSRAETLWMKNLSLETQVSFPPTICYRSTYFLPYVTVFLCFFYHKHHKLQISVSNSLVGPGQGRFTGTGIWANRFLHHPPVPFVSDTWRFSNVHLRLMGKIEKLSPVGFWHTQGWWRFLTGWESRITVFPSVEQHQHQCTQHIKIPCLSAL